MDEKEERGRPGTRPHSTDTGENLPCIRNPSAGIYLQ